MRICRSAGLENLIVAHGRPSMWQHPLVVPTTGPQRLRSTFEYIMAALKQMEPRVYRLTTSGLQTAFAWSDASFHQESERPVVNLCAVCRTSCCRRGVIAEVPAHHFDLFEAREPQIAMGELLAVVSVAGHSLWGEYLACLAFGLSTI